ncbi:helix-turn-helix domain-containing protein [Allorhodopirellula heiligendammensis]|uniref:Helix-turn-helix domain protein n=1 Tax=Allorhodopirellula heiligendammensis TaxID=2714739 RepID=A0A5C6BGH6_9BACT|nr:helix-turn-helix domain-containing protein [Allorhodopirellula heiligendammensis]TWU10812.1 Helix-turn-helix domain protein [Allorhodopirellula heiligendammensis]
MKTQHSEKQYLGTGEVAEIIGMSIQKVRALCESGRLPAVNTSAATRPRWTIRRCDLDEFMTPDCVKKTQAKQARESRRQRIDAHVPKVFS